MSFTKQNTLKQMDTKNLRSNKDLLTISYTEILQLTKIQGKKEKTAHQCEHNF